MADPIQPSALSPLARERVVEELTQHFANDRLDLAEFERRVDHAHRARTQEQLDALVADLPAIPDRSAEVEVPARAVPRAAHAEPRNIVFAFCGGATRKGGWEPAQQNLAFALMGGIEIDFRETGLPAGVTEVNAFAIMGGIDIIAPPHVTVELDGFAVLGGFDQVHNAAQPADPTRPVLRVRGLAFMGGVTVHVRLPGESARQAKRRHREELRRSTQV